MRVVVPVVAATTMKIVTNEGAEATDHMYRGLFYYYVARPT